MEDLIWQIKEKTGYKFIYNTKHLVKYQKLKVELKGELEEVLHAVLRETDLTYTIKNGTYVIQPKKEKPIQQKEKPKNKITGKGKELV